MDKVRHYDQLVMLRRLCPDCTELDHVRSLQQCCADEFGVDHIGPFSDWQGNLDAELMVVGREWGGDNTYRNQRGIDKDTDPTNQNLVALLNAIAPELGWPMMLPPSQCQQNGSRFKGPYYFTNSMLCLRRGGMSRSKKQKLPDPNPACYPRCATKFLKAQIDLVQPLVVVTLGEMAYRAAMSAYGLPAAKGAMKCIFARGPVPLTRSTTLVPLYHTGHYGTYARMVNGQNLQVDDWQLVVAAIKAARAQTN
jgi:Uracil DNA glycosylase superfamily